MSELIYSAALPAAGLVAGTLLTYLLRQRKINEMDTEIEELEGTVKSRDKKIKSLNKSLKEENATNEGLSEELAERDQNIKGLEGQVQNRDSRIDTLMADIAELRTETDATISQRDSTIKNLEGEVETRDHNIEALNTDLGNLNTQLNETNHHVEALNTQITDLNHRNQEQTDRAIRAETRVAKLEHHTTELKDEITALKAKQRAMQDDFSRLDGIGPKIASVLRSAGVKTFAKLAVKGADELREILEASNPILLKLSDPASWPEQGGMAAEGEWESLKALQKTLKEARRQEREAPLHQPETDATYLITED